MADKLTPQQFAAKVRAKYPGSYDSVSDDELTRRVVQKYPDYANSVDMSSPTPTNAVIKAAPAEWSVPWLKEKLYNIADSLTEGLPAAGATAGALIGGGGSGLVTGGTASVPGAIGGAGIGGMAGEALKQHVRRALGFEVPNTSIDAGNAIAKEGVLQGGTQALSEALPLAAGPIRKAAMTQYEKALAPTTNRMKAIVQKRAGEMMDRGVTGNLDFLSQEGQSAANQLRKPLDQAFEAMAPESTKGSGDAIIASLDKLKSKYVVDGKVAKPEAVNAIQNAQDLVGQYGSDISPKSLRKLKQVFDESVDAAGGYSGVDIATKYRVKAEKAAANSIRDILHTASPDVAALDKEISFWLDVKKIADKSGLRKTGQEGGLLKTLWPLAAAGAGGAGIGSATGAGPSVGAASAVVLATLATRAVRSPLWRTTSAVTKNALADAISREDTKAVAAILGRLGISIGESLNQQPQGDLPTSPSEQLKQPPNRLQLRP